LNHDPLEQSYSCLAELLQLRVRPSNTWSSHPIHRTIAAGGCGAGPGKLGWLNDTCVLEFLFRQVEESQHEQFDFIRSPATFFDQFSGHQQIHLRLSTIIIISIFYTHDDTIIYYYGTIIFIFLCHDWYFLSFLFH
jgi:hypothetical protein